MSEKKRVVLVFTGGTISMQVDPVIGAAIPVLSGEEILKSAPSLAHYADFEIFNFARLPGPHMTPKLMLELAAEVRSLLARPDITGVVITHGTDTLEETAYCLDLVLHEDKPVVLVGAMRNNSQPGWDGPPNLIAAVRTAVDDAARGLGVLVVMNDEIHAAADVTKTHTESPTTFQSPNFGYLGVLDKDGVYIRRRPTRREHLPATEVDDLVDLFKMAAGMDDRMIRSALSSGTHGLVIEALGCGNVPVHALPGIHLACEAGLPVVVTSRCLRGRVNDTYGYPGGGKELRQMGAILTDFLSGQKARLKLMLALGMTSDVEEIRKLFGG